MLNSASFPGSLLSFSLRNLQSSSNSTSSSFDSLQDRSSFLFYLIILTAVFGLILITIFCVRRYYRKKKALKSSPKPGKAELKSIFDDRFGIIDNEGEEALPDKSMVNKFLEENVKKVKDDKNFNYISAKNVFNIEGEESEYYDTKKQDRISENMEEESGQLSQNLDKINDETNNSNVLT